MKEVNIKPGCEHTGLSYMEFVTHGKREKENTGLSSMEFVINAGQWVHLSVTVLIVDMVTTRESVKTAVFLDPLLTPRTVVSATWEDSCRFKESAAISGLKDADRVHRRWTNPMLLRLI
jgi:hypothetical protein